jgi:hypothetical protein
VRKKYIIISFIILVCSFFLVRLNEFNTSFEKIQYDVSEIATDIKENITNKHILDENLINEYNDLNQLIVDLYKITPRSRLMDVEILEYKLNRIQKILDNYDRIMKYEENQMYEVNLILDNAIN